MTKFSFDKAVSSDPYILFPEYKDDKSVYFRTGTAHYKTHTKKHECDCMYCHVKTERWQEWEEDTIDEGYYGVSKINIQTNLLGYYIAPISILKETK